MTRQPQPADFGLLAGTDKVGRVIEVLETLNGDGFSTFSHALILLPDGQVFEAEPGGARIAPVSEYTDTITWSDWDLSDETRAKIIELCQNKPPNGYLGVPYSYLDYAALAAKRLHVPWPGLREYVASTGHMICSQITDAIYLGAGEHMFADNRWPGYVTPQDLKAVLHGPLVA